jgi:xanthine dehydrogenase YagR molybdenum-binding subunit
MSTTIDRPSNTGRPVDRVDGPLKVTGGALYAADTRVENALFAVIVQSTISRGRIAGIDERAARAIGGVVDIMTFRNAPRVAQTGFDMMKGQVFPEAALMPLQSGEIRYWGQHIAVVIATTLEAATTAAAHLHISYDALPANVTINSLTRTHAVPVDNFMGTPLNVERGDFERGLAAAATHVDVTYTTPAHTHNAMEPSATVAWWSGDDLTVHDSTQWINGTQTTLANFFGIDPKNVRIVCPFLGGGFGSKGWTWPHTVIAAMAAKHTGRAVKLVVDRSQFFTSNGHRSLTEQRIRAGVAADGKLTALAHDVLDTTATAGDWTEPCAMVTQMLYDVPNLRTSHQHIMLDIATPTAMRAPGETPGSFALESALDELAVAAGIDPLELRVRNHADRDPSSGLPWSSKHLLECYHDGARRFGWDRRTPAARSMRAGNELIGMGMATATYPGMAGATGVRVHVENAGRVIVECATHDLGTGMYTVLAQVASDTLGIPIEHVTVKIGDSAFPKAPVAGGSQSTASVMPPLIDACNQLKAAAGGDVASAQPGLEATATASGESDDTHYSFHSFGAHFCEVRFDEDLARLRVTRFTSVFDCGRIINPKTARSQMIGGITMGLGMALMEETLRDERSGAIITNNLADYHVPVNADVPAFDISFVEHPDLVFNSLGVRGVGEIGITGVAAAVANAVYHASGRRVRNLPILPERLM